MAKKKAKALNYLEQAIAEVLGEPCTNRAELKPLIDQFISSSRQLKDILHLDMGAYDTPRITAENVSVMKKIYENSVEEFTHYLRGLIVGEWLENRVVYCIQPETTEFLRTSFPLSRSNAHAQPLIEFACRTPIFIDFPRGSPVLSAFCGITRLVNQNMALKEDTFQPSLVAFIIFPDGISRALITSISDASIHDIMSDKSGGPEARAVIEALIYIALANSAHDAIGTILEPRTKWQATCYDLLPFPEDASLPDFDDPNGYVAAGFCLKFGYLRREAMLKDMLEEMDELTEEDRTLTYQTKLSHAQVTYLISSMVIDAETNRVIYQATGHAIEQIYQAHEADILLFGFPADLLRHFPHKTIVIGEKDTSKCYLVSIQECTDYPDPCIAILSLDDEQPSVTLLPTISVLQGIDVDFLTGVLKHQELLSVLCLLYHILRVLEGRSETNLQNPPFHFEPIRTPGLIPVRTISAEPAAHRGYRKGSALESLELFSVTATAVRRVTTGEMRRRYGWKMVPHTRRRHPHRYWVGKGDDRHIEVRWLEEMHINASQGIEQLPTVKEITV